MPIDERKLRDILAEQEANIKRHVQEQGEGIKRYVEAQIEEQDTSLKRHVGVLVEETDRKFGIVSEGYQALSDKIDGVSERLDVELAGVRKELEEIRALLFRKADLERLQALEQRVGAMEKRVFGK
jgi:hypothetical protein